MKKNNYLILLFTLSSKEVTLFTNYLNIFYHGQKGILNIHEYYQYFHKKKKKLPQIKAAYQEIYGRPSASENDLMNLRNGHSDLHKVLKDFLIHQKSIVKGIHKELLWNEILEERGLFHQNKLHVKKLFKSFPKKNCPNIWQTFHQFKLNHDIYFRNDKSSKEEAFRLEEALSNLDEFHENMTLKLTSEKLNVARILKSSQTENKIKNSTKPASILRQFYRLLFRFRSEYNMETSKEFQDFLHLNSSAIPLDEKLISIIYIANFLSEEIKKGTEIAILQAWENYHFAIQEKLLVKNGFIDRNTYENIISIAGMNTKLNEAKQFAYEYKKFLPINWRKDTFQLMMADIAFRDNQHEQVLILLEEIELADIFQELRARTLKLQSYFELNQLDLIDEKCSNFIRFLRRNKKKLNGYNKEAAGNFAKILKQFTKINISKEILIKSIETTTPLFYKEWLLSKVPQ